MILEDYHLIYQVCVLAIGNLSFVCMAIIMIKKEGPGFGCLL